MLCGIAASSGIAIGKAYKLVAPVLNIQKDSAKDNELEILDKALEKTVSDIEKVKERASKNLNEEELAIFDAHLMMANDPEIKNQIVDLIKNENVCSEYAVQEVSKTTIAFFESMDDAYFKERVQDVKDVMFRLLCNLAGVEIPDLTTIDSEVIIVSKDLTPSDTAQLNKKYTLGFATEIGGRTSHSAIMARSLEIPAIVGIKELLDTVNNNDLLILDAINGLLLVNPDEKTVNEFKERQKAYIEEKELLKVLKNEKSISMDGHEVELAGNIGSLKDMDGVLENGADGIGLFRTEFLYMNSDTDFPDEETQFNAYKTVLERMDNKKVVIRTLDIGGDKKLKYFEFPEEMNPFLGYRAIRFCLDRKDIFRVQLRALLRASVYGRLAIMFPMIATLDEFRDAKKVFLEEKEKLVNDGIKVSDNIELGIMIEIPAAAVLADVFAKEVDFFSIGTNDLIQYTMAADRMSEKVSYLYQPLNPSLLRLIKLAIDGAHKEGKWCGMCGEMAGDASSLPILLGLGLDEFSMSASSILNSRKIIRNLSKKDMEELANKALGMSNKAEVEELVKNILK